MRKRVQPRSLIVIRKQQLTPHMLRVTLGGPDMFGFPEGHESANCKLSLPSIGGGPVFRTYTIRAFDPDRREVDIDFVLHRDHGRASSWAIEAQLGDRIEFRGPGKPKWINHDADWYFFAGDMSALPAIGANIERLPRIAKGYAVLEIIDYQDRQALGFPTGIEVDWVENVDPNTPNSLLLDRVVSKPWQPGRASVWVAGETGTTRNLRRYFKQERAVDVADLYASGYWQIGLTEDIHQRVKRQQGG